jgi:23S rRNA pseudouridine1911/1915/1917 synthase
MSGRTETILVEQTLLAERLDQFLRTKLPDVSRGAIQRLIEEGHIKVDGKNVKPTHHPRAGETIEVFFPEAKPAEAQPQEIPLDILFEDKDLLVLNKAPGMVVHPAAGHDDSTLVNALLHHCKGQLSGIGGVARPGIVHRLDKDTSGCLVVAKNDAAHLALAEQFSGRSVEKIYNAIVCGELTRDKGEIHGAIARHPTDRKRMAIMESGGREAHTSFQVMEHLRGATLLEIQIHTGRTHQIRVHFQHAGFPVVGDEVYGIRPNKKLTEVTGYKAPRQMLHARKLTFAHPKTGKMKSFEAPWPEDFKAAVKALSRR